MNLTYKSSGVSIDAGNDAVSKIVPIVKATHNSRVLNSIGNFGGFFELPSGYREPVLVSCTDGVGTKLRLAIETKTLNTVGIDLVAMNVNDLICSGAEPLFFLDYIAVHSLVPDHVTEIITGISEGCIESECALIGGEMAEMNDMYQPNDFDLAGFCVGVVEKQSVIDGSQIRPGDALYGLPSSGVHSNGYSLVRKVLERDKDGELSIPELLKPTRIYVKEIKRLKKLGHPLNGIAHITGGGLVENINRIIPKGLKLDIDYEAIETPAVFEKIARIGQVPAEEMWRVFNMGVGMVIVSPEPLPASMGAIKIGSVTG